MSTGRADSFCRHEHARPYDDSFVNRVTQRNIDKFTAAHEAAAEIAHSCEASLDCCPRVSRRFDRLLRNIEIKLFQTPFVEVAREIEGQVRVRVHESGRKRRVAEIDHPRAGRDGQIAANIDNLVAVHDDDAILHERFRFTVEHPRCFQHDCLIGGNGCSSRQQEDCNNSRKRETRRNSHLAGLESIRAGSKEVLVSVETLRFNRADENSAARLRCFARPRYHLFYTGVACANTARWAFSLAEGIFSGHSGLRSSLGRKNSDAR